MPQKEAATSATGTRKSSRATKAATPEPAVNGTSKSVTKASKATTASKATKATTKTTKKSATKAAPKATKKEMELPKNSKKRKAEDDEDEPETNGTKRARRESDSSVTESEAEEAAPAKRKVAATKAPKAVAAKKPRTATATINHAPIEPLNVYVFGDGTNGELGLGNGKNCAEVKRPRLNPHLSSDTVGVVSVSVGGMHTAVLTKDNKILTWGVNDQGALGRNTDWEGGLRDMDDDKSDSDSDSDTGSGLNPKESTPGEVDLAGVPADTTWTQLACCDSATFALTSEGLVYGCGTFRSNEGIFGFSPSNLIQRTLTLIPELKKITKIVAGANHVLALDNKGQVFAWGSGQQNQLGRRILERFLKNSLVPTQFGLPKQMINIGAGSYHSFAMHKNGALYSWGLNSFGETGITDNFEAEGESDVHHPKIVPNLESYGKVTQVEGGSHHTIARTDKGECLVWGRLDGFQLGLKIDTLPSENVIKDSHDHPRILRVPTQVPNIDAAYVAAGSDHSIAVDKDGRAYAWGFSTSYQTGLGTDEEVEVAQHIDNTAVRGKQLVWAGAGGQFSVIAGLAGVENVAANGVNGHA